MIPPLYPGQSSNHGVSVAGDDEFVELLAGVGLELDPPVAARAEVHARHEVPTEGGREEGRGRQAREWAGRVRRCRRLWGRVGASLRGLGAGVCVCGGAESVVGIDESLGGSGERKYLLLGCIPKCNLYRESSCAWTLLNPCI